MIKPQKKNPDIDEFARKINPTGKDRVESIENQECATCDDADLEFRNSISVKEYSISGMCQKCQDKIFGHD